MVICVVALASISSASAALVRLAANHLSTPSTRQYNIDGVLVTDEMFFKSARVLVEVVTENNLQALTIYPPLTDIGKVSLANRVAVASKAW